MNAEYACELAYKRAEPRNSFVFFYPFFHFFFSSLFLKNKRRTNLFLYYFNFLFQLLLSSSLFSFTLLFSKMGYKYYDAHQISVSLFPLSSFSLSLSLSTLSHSHTCPINTWQTPPKGLYHCQRWRIPEMLHYPHQCLQQVERPRRKTRLPQTAQQARGSIRECLCHAVRVGMGKSMGVGIGNGVRGPIF